MTEFHRWKGERLKEKPRQRRWMRRLARKGLSLLFFILLFAFLLAVVWMISGYTGYQ